MWRGPGRYSPDKLLKTPNGSIGICPYLIGVTQRVYPRNVWILDANYDLYKTVSVEATSGHPMHFYGDYIFSARTWTSSFPYWIIDKTNIHNNNKVSWNSVHAAEPHYDISPEFNRVLYARAGQLTTLDYENLSLVKTLAIAGMKRATIIGKHIYYFTTSEDFKTYSIYRITLEEFENDESPTLLITETNETKQFDSRDLIPDTFNKGVYCYYAYYIGWDAWDVYMYITKGGVEWTQVISRGNLNNNYPIRRWGRHSASVLPYGLVHFYDKLSPDDPFYIDRMVAITYQSNGEMEEKLNTRLSNYPRARLATTGFDTVLLASSDSEIPVRLVTVNLNNTVIKDGAPPQGMSNIVARKQPPLTGHWVVSCENQDVVLITPMPPTYQFHCFCHVKLGHYGGDPAEQVFVEYQWRVVGDEWDYGWLLCDINDTIILESRWINKAPENLPVDVEFEILDITWPGSIYRPTVNACYGAIQTIEEGDLI